MPHREYILSEASRLVVTERNASYGDPRDDFLRTATMWNVLFKDKLGHAKEFVPSDVARALICVKLSRTCQAKSEDNWVDIAGYAACGSECEELGD